MRGLSSLRSLSQQWELLPVLRIIQWVVPALMFAIGVSYTLVENTRHVNQPGWPWMTALGFLVLGVAGPVSSWFVLGWAYRVAAAYVDSQEDLSRRVEQLAALNKLALASSHSLDLERTITTILTDAVDTLDAQAGMVFIQEPGRPELRLEAYLGISDAMAAQEALLVPDHCLCGQSAGQRRVLFAQDVSADPRCTSDLCGCNGFRSVACAPLEAKGQLVGLLQLASPEAGHFTSDQTDFLTAAAAQVSSAIENARLYDAVRTFNTELEQQVAWRTAELEAAQAALSQKARQLQNLLSESYRVQETTQTRIAQDMHDGVTQLVIGALYETQAARRALFVEPERAARSLAIAQQHLSEIENEIRQVIYDLHPPILDMMGVVAALERFAASFRQTFGIECAILTAGQPRRLDGEVEIAIYRIVQAALHNVAAHASAGRAGVRLHFREDNLQIEIEDDGAGFNPQAFLASPGNHLGLIGMKERAEGIGAGLDIVSSPGEGTRIRLYLDPAPYRTG